MGMKQTVASRPHWTYRLLLSWSEGREIDGLWAGSWRKGPDLDRIAKALALIKQHSPVHYGRVIRDLKRVWVYVLVGGMAEYDSSLDACLLDERYVANSTIERIASTIIHEATHARLERLGLTYKEELRSRIETICFRRELAFVAKLPNGSELQDELVRSVEWYGANNEWFSDANFRVRYSQESAEAFRYVEMPKWIIRATPTMRPIISAIRRLYQRVVRPT
jgi:hypothetical protein